MKRCKKGHYYDEQQYDHCPRCDMESNEDSETVAIETDRKFSRSSSYGSNSYAGESNIYSGSYSEHEEPVYGTDGYTEGYGYLDYYNDTSGEETVGLYRKVKGFSPVVGWLVCVDGASKGKDFAIRPERNFIGRDPSMDICIGGDNTISARKHAIISYNPKESVFRVLPGEGHGIVYLNNKEVFNAEELKRGDMIQIGQTNMIFIPLCGEDFTW